MWGQGARGKIGRGGGVPYPVGLCLGVEVGYAPLGWGLGGPLMGVGKRGPLLLKMGITLSFRWRSEEITHG